MANNKIFIQKSEGTTVSKSLDTSDPMFREKERDLLERGFEQSHLGSAGTTPKHCIKHRSVGVSPLASFLICLSFGAGSMVTIYLMKFV